MRGYACWFVKTNRTPWEATCARVDTKITISSYGTCFTPYPECATGGNGHLTPRTPIDEIDIADVPAVWIESAAASSVHSIVEYPRYIVTVCNPKDKSLLPRQRQSHMKRGLSPLE